MAQRVTEDQLLDAFRRTINVCADMQKLYGRVPDPDNEQAKARSKRKLFWEKWAPYWGVTESLQWLLDNLTGGFGAERPLREYSDLLECIARCEEQVKEDKAKKGR